MKKEEGVSMHLMTHFSAVKEMAYDHIHVHVVRMWAYENSSVHMRCHLFDAMPTPNAGES